MAGRSPARFLAPLALVAFVVALFAVVSSSRDPGTDEEPASNRATETRPASQEERSGDGAEEDADREREPRRYTVEPGDTPSSIAEETGVPLEEILRLNPNLDPQTLSPGTRLRLRQ
jgi:LysM repeat protein